MKESETIEVMNFAVILRDLISNYPLMINKGTGMKVNRKMSNVKTASHFLFESNGVIWSSGSALRLPKKRIRTTHNHQPFQANPSAASKKMITGSAMREPL
jgi:hypothetical protein